MVLGFFVRGVAEVAKVGFRRGFVARSYGGNSVEVINTDNFQCEVTIVGKSPFKYICDHNATKPAGPSPREYLLGALASCTAMTLKTFVKNSAKMSPSTW